jgi:hypothetical protein
VLESRIVSIAIRRPWNEVYEAIWHPEAFPRWASGLSKSSLTRQAGGAWTAESLTGSVTIRFTDHNPFGVMDHYVKTTTGSVVYVPMRVIANMEGAEVSVTVFRQPDMSERQFLDDIEWVKRDLVALKALLG